MRVDRVTEYPTFRAMLEEETVAACLPGVDCLAGREAMRKLFPKGKQTSLPPEPADVLDFAAAMYDVIYDGYDETVIAIKVQGAHNHTRGE